MEMITGPLSWTWHVEAPRIAGERAAVGTWLKEKGNEGADMAIYSTIFGADEEKSESLNRASGDGRKLRVREVTLPFSAIPDGTIHGTAPASLVLDRRKRIVLNTFFTAACPVTEGHTGELLKFSVCKPKPWGYCKKDEKAVFSQCSVPGVPVAGPMLALLWSVVVEKSPALLWRGQGLEIPFWHSAPE